MLSRRGFLGSLAVALAAPAIIRTPGLLMPVRSHHLADEAFAGFSLDDVREPWLRDYVSGLKVPVHVFWASDNGVMTTVGGQPYRMVSEVFDHDQAVSRMRFLGFSIPADMVNKKVGGYSLKQEKG
jgi:hypothetical protein